MAANKVIRFGPAALANSAADILNCKVTSMAGPTGITIAQPYLIIRHIRIVNKTAGAVTFSLYIGASGGSAAGTEFIGTALSVPANSAYDWYGLVRLDNGDYLSGLASAATSLTIEGEGEVGIS
jgi:hypothetical protein